MVGDECEIATIIEQGNSAILNKKGWVFVTYYQSKNGADGSRAYKLALGKANSIDREAGIRCFKKNEYTVFEVWERW